MDDNQSDTPRERRVQGALRALVDDMMEQIRLAAGHNDWAPEERARAEADLARIMDQVRQEALARGRR
ncbi:MAG TPA: hypothetical protein VGE02_12680 [Gemmatimonadales bacterium]